VVDFLRVVPDPSDVVHFAFVPSQPQSSLRGAQRRSNLDG
jgi:hypothetical protein